jgi:SAM-dependent methyltransferase
MVIRTTSQPMYENGLLSQVTGGPLHPGGQDLTARLITLCDLPAGAIVLDVGSGTGLTIGMLLDDGFNAMGVDRSEMLLRSGKVARPDLPLICSLGDVLAVANEHVDAVISECSLSAIANLEPMLSEFCRVLRPAGCLAISDLYLRNPRGLPALRALPLSCGLHEAMTKADLVSKLQKNKFRLLTWEDHSDTLKYLAAQMILSHGSMADFWRQSEPTVDPMEIQQALQKVELGYYLLVAEKT